MLFIKEGKDFQGSLWKTRGEESEDSEVGCKRQTPITGRIFRHCQWNHKPYATCPLLHKASVKVIQTTEVLGVLHPGHHEMR